MTAGSSPLRARRAQLGERRDGVAVVILASILAAVFWPTWDLVPTYGGDPSWHLGLSWAAKLGFQWGTDVIFTYGPLGYLHDPMAFSRPQVLIASLVHVAGSLLVVTLAYYACRVQLELNRALALLLSGLAGGLSVWIVGPELATVLIGSSIVLTRRSWIVLLVVGVALGVIGQEKLSTAVLGLGFAVFCIVGGLGPRGLLALAFVTGVTWLGTWVAAGQSIANVPTWIVGAVDTSLGHADALALEKAGTLWHYPVAIGLSIAAIGLSVLVGGPLGRRRKASLVLATCWYLWLAWNAGFNRHDDGHAELFFNEVVALSVAMILVAMDRRALQVGLIMAVTAYVAGVPLRGPFLAPVDRSASLHSLSETAAVLTSDEVRDSLLADAARQLTDQYAITSEVRDALGSGPALADVGSISAIWAASGPAWKPIPALQLLTAYTDRLDQANFASMVEQPRLILRNYPYQAGDDRYPAWNSPRYQTLVYCGYEVGLTAPRWQVLRPAGVDRCHEPEDPVSIYSKADEGVPVPYRPGRMTVVSIRPELSWFDLLRGTLLKPHVMSIRYGQGTWRYTFGDVATRLMLNAPVWSETFPDQPLTPFETISLDRPAQLTFEFVTVATPAVGGSEQGEPRIDDVIIRAAEPEGLDSRMLKRWLDNDVTIENEVDDCVTVQPTGEDPALFFNVPDGEALLVTSSDGGTVQVFLEVQGQYSAAQSRRVTVRDEPIEVYVDTGHASGEQATTAHAIRIDPPETGLTTICGSVAPVD